MGILYVGIDLAKNVFASFTPFTPPAHHHTVEVCQRKRNAS